MCVSLAGPSRGWFQRSKVLQIQACLRMVLEWSSRSGLGHLSDKFFTKLNSTVTILATPPQQLTQVTNTHRQLRTWTWRKQITFKFLTSPTCLLIVSPDLVFFLYSLWTVKLANFIHWTFNPETCPASPDSYSVPAHSRNRSCPNMAAQQRRWGVYIQNRSGVFEDLYDLFFQAVWSDQIAEMLRLTVNMLALHVSTV